MKFIKFFLLTTFIATSSNLAHASSMSEEALAATKTGLLYYACACHKSTELLIQDKIHELEKSQDQLMDDMTSINSECDTTFNDVWTKHVNNLREREEEIRRHNNLQPSERIGKEQAGEKPLRYNIYTEVVNELAGMSKTITLTNSQLSFPVLCNEELHGMFQDAERTLRNSSKVYDQRLLQCFDMRAGDIGTEERQQTLERRAECLFTAREPTPAPVVTIEDTDTKTSDPEDNNTDVGVNNVFDDLIIEQLEEHRKTINTVIENYCTCDYIQTRAQKLECVNIVRGTEYSWIDQDNATSLDMDNDQNIKRIDDAIEEYKGTLVCDNQGSKKDELDDDYLLSCVSKGAKGAQECEAKLTTRLQKLYCHRDIDSGLNCVDGLKEVILNYNHAKVEDPCRENSGFPDRDKCEGVAAKQFLLNNHSANFFLLMCPINWTNCENNSELCRKEEEKCKENLVKQMISKSQENFNNTSQLGFLKSITAEKIAKSCEVDADSTWKFKEGATNFKSDKSNDGCLLQKFAVDNNMNHIDLEIMSMCQVEVARARAEDANYDFKQDLEESVNCYFEKNIRIADEELMKAIEDKYCQEGLYTSGKCNWDNDARFCKNECMNRMLSRNFAAVDPSCLEKPNALERRICSIEANLKALAESNFPITSCFNENLIPNRLDRRECRDVGHKLDEEMQKCRDHQFPLECIDELMKNPMLSKFHTPECTDEKQKRGECLSILNEYVNTMLAWQKPDLREVASTETCVSEGYADDARGHLECEMMKLAQFKYNNRNAYIDRNFYCQTSEAAAQSETCNPFNTPYVEGSDVSSLALLDPPPPPPPGGNGGGTDPQANGNITGVVAASGTGVMMNQNTGSLNRGLQVKVGDKMVALDSSLLSGAKGDGVMGFLKDFKYVKYMESEDPVCKGLGKAALTRVIGTFGGALTTYFVHIKVMKDYKEEIQEEDPNAQVKAMDHLKQGYKGVLAGLGVKLAFNLIAKGVASNALAIEQARVSQPPNTPTVCSSSEQPSIDNLPQATSIFDRNIDPVLVPNKEKSEFFITELERAQNEVEMRIIFDEFSDYTTSTRVSSLSVDEYKEKEMQYMLETIGEEFEPDTLDVMKSGFSNLIRVTSNAIIPKAHAEMDASQIMMLMPLIMPLLNNIGKKDEAKESDNNNNRNVANNPITGAGDNVDAATGLTEVLENEANDTTTTKAIQGDTTTKMNAIENLATSLGGEVIDNSETEENNDT